MILCVLVWFGVGRIFGFVMKCGLVDWNDRIFILLLSMKGICKLFRVIILEISFGCWWVIYIEMLLLLEWLIRVMCL